MVWTYPMTFTANTVLTAAQLNTHLRDNLLETEVATADSNRHHFIVDGPNKLVRRAAAGDRLNTSETYSSADWGDLATIGPAVTVETGTTALVIISCRAFNDSLGRQSQMSWAVSGATERDPQRSTGVMYDGQTATDNCKGLNVDLFTTLNPGTNTFTAKYRTSSDTYTATFADRNMIVLPL